MKWTKKRERERESGRINTGESRHRRPNGFYLAMEQIYRDVTVFTNIFFRVMNSYFDEKRHETRKKRNITIIIITHILHEKWNRSDEIAQKKINHVT